jgi:hypothetical protein
VAAVGTCKVERSVWARYLIGRSRDSTKQRERIPQRRARDQPEAGEAGVGCVTLAADGWRPGEQGRERAFVGGYCRRTGLTHALEVDIEATRVLYESRVVVLVDLDKVAYLPPELGVFRLGAIELIREGSKEAVAV